MEGSPAGRHQWLTYFDLVTDGGEFRRYSSLFILNALMREISHLEVDDRPRASSANPLQHHTFVASQHRSIGPVTASQTHDIVQCTIDRGDPDRLSHFLVSQYFNYIAGTSTGGCYPSVLSLCREIYADNFGDLRLIAIMLARFFMSIDVCIKAYEELIPKIFAKPRLLQLRIGWWHRDTSTTPNRWKGQSEALWKDARTAPVRY